MSQIHRARAAAIDIGTNSVLLTIADVSANDLHVVQQRATVTRLGQDVDRTRRLHPDAVERTLACLREYRSVIDDFGSPPARAVGTSALRDAEGGAAFIARASEVLGFSPEVISGMREAELTFAGALSGMDHVGRVFVFDIGGGSTELILGSVEKDGALFIDRGVSLDVGSVRLTERCQVQDPPTKQNLDRIRKAIRGALNESGMFAQSAEQVVGVAGTVTTLAAIEKRMKDYDPAVIHGYELRASSVSHLVELLARKATAERRLLPGLSPGRADVIVAGALLCEEIMSYCGAHSLTVSDRGVRFGLIREAGEQNLKIR